MKASILVICWNYEQYIKQCLESILAQTYKDIEVLFLDNFSKDNSYQTAKSILESSGISHQIFQNSSPQSVSKNFNFLLERCSGDYIFPFSADDWMTPDNVEEKVDLLKSTNAGIVFGGGWYFYEDTGKYIQSDLSLYKRGNMVNNLLLDRSSYFHPGPAYKKSVIIEVGKWDEDLLVEDLDLNLRVAMKHDVDFVPKPLIYYRKHSSSFLSNYKLMSKGFQQYYEKYRNFKSLPLDEWLSQNYKWFSFQALDDKKYSLSFHFLFLAVKTYFGVHSIIVIGEFIRRYFSRFKLLRRIWLPFKYYLVKK
ncbi:MAG TPA: glycosyltransferase family 2 protein [Segetibacter sp.]